MNLRHLGCLTASLAWLCLGELSAQPIQRSNVPAPAFEVTGSIYPWEVHDEGIDLILDNMTGIAGINSVYLIAVMHEEHRPFNNDKLPGTSILSITLCVPNGMPRTPALTSSLKWNLMERSNQLCRNTPGSMKWTG